jgi:hypothetical protein
LEGAGGGTEEVAVDFFDVPQQHFRLFLFGFGDFGGEALTATPASNSSLSYETGGDHKLQPSTIFYHNFALDINKCLLDVSL